MENKNGELPSSEPVVNIGWYPIARSDVQKILNNAAAKNGPSLVCVWTAIMDIANSERRATFDSPVAAIARKAGLAYKATLTALHRLQEINMLKITTRKAFGSNENEISTYQVITKVSLNVNTNKNENAK
jgi:hypothetical protein